MTDSNDDMEPFDYDQIPSILPDWVRNGPQWRMEALVAFTGMPRDQARRIVMEFKDDVEQLLKWLKRYVDLVILVSRLASINQAETVKIVNRNEKDPLGLLEELQLYGDLTILPSQRSLGSGEDFSSTSFHDPLGLGDKKKSVPITPINDSDKFVKNVVVFFPIEFSSEFDDIEFLSEDDLANLVSGAAYEVSSAISEYFDQSLQSISIIRWSGESVSGMMDLLEVGGEAPKSLFIDNKIDQEIALVVEHSDADWNYAFTKISESLSSAFWVIGLSSTGDVVINEYDQGDWSDGFNIDADEYRNIDRNVRIMASI